LIPIRFVPAGSELARRRFPDLDVGSTLVDVTVITDEGAVLRGDRAWIAVLWAVSTTRPFAIRLANGRGTWRLHSVRSATEAIRSLAAGKAYAYEPVHTGSNPSWPPPRWDNGSQLCPGCQT
jgi:hypothetical protein